MKQSRKRSSSGNDAASNKRRKHVNDEIPTTETRAKSKKELRLERKAAQRAKSEAKNVDGKEESTKQKRREEQKLERRAKKEEKERAMDARFEEQNRLRKERQSEKQQSTPKHSRKDKDKAKKTDKKDALGSDDYAVYKSIFKKTKDPTTGATTCRLGVQYIDAKVGTGPMVHSKSLVTVKYQLRGKNPDGPLIDSSKKFSFRMGKGEVIQGWDIGLEGMRQGGVRHLIVPPKAGYGSQDIGAGPGAMLHFDVTLSEILR